MAVTHTQKKTLGREQESFTLLSLELLSFHFIMASHIHFTVAGALVFGGQLSMNSIVCVTAQVGAKTIE